MKKLVIFIVIVVGTGFWFKNFVQSGQLERYLDSNPNPTVNPAVEYYWGMLLSFANHNQSAVYRFTRVIAKYPKSEYAPLAWVEYIETLDNMGDRAKTIEQSKIFLQSEYADHPKAEIVRKKVKFYEQGL
jgi:hypothetical protein